MHAHTPQDYIEEKKVIYTTVHEYNYTPDVKEIHLHIINSNKVKTLHM